MYKSKAQKFIKKWGGTEFLGCSTTSSEFKKFVKEFKTLMKGVGDVHVKSFKGGHFETSGFIQLGDDFVYIAISDVRHYQDKWQSVVLYRTATGPTDYTGGSNNYCKLEDLEEKVQTLIY